MERQLYVPTDLKREKVIDCPIGREIDWHDCNKCPYNDGMDIVFICCNYIPIPLMLLKMGEV